jgi:hypothetical protein
MQLFGIHGSVLLFPQAAGSNDFTVIATTTDVVSVVPSVRAARLFAVLALVSNTKVNQKPGEMPPHGGPPSIWRSIPLDDHLKSFVFTAASGRKRTLTRSCSPLSFVVIARGFERK